MTPIKIAFYDAKDYDIESFNHVNDKGLFDIKFYETKLSIDTVKLASGADAVCVFVNDIIDKDVIDGLKALRINLIALRCAGYNNVDIDYADGNIHVVRVPAYSPEAVAEHAMALLLTSVRRIHKAFIRTRDFNFRLNGLTGFNLNGKTVGVVGTGKIGKAFIQICKGFGMKVIAYDKFPATNLDIEYVTMEELFKESDIISFHCPLTNENKHIVNENTINTMKKGVILINTSRGALINSLDLLNGIKDRKIGAACLDVYEEESNVFFHDFSDHIVDDDTLARLISMPNVIVTSHQAFLTKEALNNIAITTLDNITEFIGLGKCQNEICYKCPK